ncbi:hypothetical protein, partial [Neisseria meningitidis]|uniref:hypothetical protein n=1 Tax=Neisseria meningitidis TaxID=487 RepID=UPI003C751603
MALRTHFVISNVPSTPTTIRGRELEGKLILEVPAQVNPIPQSETFAKFLSLTTAETPTQVFSCFRPKYRLILPKYPLNPPRIPD